MKLTGTLRAGVFAAGLVTALGVSELTMPRSAQARELGLELNLKIGNKLPDLSRYETETPPRGWHIKDGDCSFKNCDIYNDPNIIAISRLYDLNEDGEMDAMATYTNCPKGEEKPIILVVSPKKGYIFKDGVVDKIIRSEEPIKESDIAKYIPDCE